MFCNALLNVLSWNENLNSVFILYLRVSTTKLTRIRLIRRQVNKSSPSNAKIMTQNYSNVRDSKEGLAYGVTENLLLERSSIRTLTTSVSLSSAEAQETIDNRLLNV